MRVTPDGRFAYVSSESAQQVSIIDTATNRVVKQLKVGLRPRSIAFTPDGAKAYVPGEFDGTITVIDAQAITVLKTIQLDDKNARPMDAIVAPDGRSLYVSTGRGRTVVHVDTRIDRVLAHCQVGARPWGLAISPDGKRIYSANGPSNDRLGHRGGFVQGDRDDCGRQGPWGVAVAEARFLGATYRLPSPRSRQRRAAFEASHSRRCFTKHRSRAVSLLSVS